MQQDIQKIEQVQRRAARYSFNDYKNREPGCVSAMLDKLEWDSLEDRRHKARLTMLYKIHHGLVDIDPTKHYQLSDPRTRGAQRLHVEHANHPALYHSFFPRTLRSWNKLPISTTSSPTLNSFRASIGCSTSDLQPAPSLH